MEDGRRNYLGGRRKYQRRPPERREVGLKGPNIGSGKFWRERYFGGRGVLSSMLFSWGSK